VGQFESIQVKSFNNKRIHDSSMGVLSTNISAMLNEPVRSTENEGLKIFDRRSMPA
jgi:hypothetical protein